MTEPKREPGWYRAKLWGKWQFVRFHPDGVFFFTGDERPVEESDFDEIMPGVLDPAPSAIPNAGPRGQFSDEVQAAMNAAYSWIAGPGYTTADDPQVLLEKLRDEGFELVRSDELARLRQEKP